MFNVHLFFLRHPLGVVQSDEVRQQRVSPGVFHDHLHLRARLVRLHHPHHVRMSHLRQQFNLAVRLSSLRVRAEHPDVRLLHRARRPGLRVLAQVHRPLLSDADFLPHDVLVRESRVEVDERERARGRGRARGGRGASHASRRGVPSPRASSCPLARGRRRARSLADAVDDDADGRAARERDANRITTYARRDAAPRRSSGELDASRARRRKVTFSSSSSPRRSPPRAPSTPPRPALC